MKILGDAVAAVPKMQIDALSYRGNSLDLKVTATSMGALSQLTQLIGKQGVTAEIQSSTPSAAGVEAHLQLRDAAARAHR